MTKFPEPNDSSRVVNNDSSFESWKKDIMRKYGDVVIVLDKKAKYFDRISVLDKDFMSDKDKQIKGKQAWVDAERKAGRNPR